MQETRSICMLRVKLNKGQHISLEGFTLGNVYKSNYAPLQDRFTTGLFVILFQDLNLTLLCGQGRKKRFLIIVGPI